MDLARLFPAEKPIEGVKGSFLYRLFRSEFLRNYPIALSSDCYSAWVRTSPDGPENEEEASKATQFLQNTTIPQMIEAGDLNQLEDENLKEALHKWGINLRYCAFILGKLINSSARKVIALHISARSFRAIMDESMRMMVEPRDSESYFRLIANHFTLLLTESQSAVDFWKNRMRPDMIKRFVNFEGTSSGALSLIR